MENFFEDSNPNASAEYKALVRRLAELLVEATESCGEDFADAQDLADASVETALDTTADLHLAVHDVCKGNFPRQTAAEWVSGLCLDQHDECEARAQKTNDPVAWENEALWASAAYNLQEVD